MPRFCLFLVLTIGSTIAPLAAAQSTSDIYAIRQDLRNDAYVWEPMLKASAPKAAPKPMLINPAGTTAQQGPQQPVYDQTAQSVMNYYNRRRGYRAPVAPPSPRAAAATQSFVTQASYTEPAGERPFASVSTQPTVTAYLGLFREEFEESTPNYYQFVRPRLQQEQQVRQQRIEMERRRRQGRALPPAQRPAGAETSGGASRYGDTGRYYSAWTR